jgi:hypothetical protein
MPKTQKRWGYSPPRPPKPKVPEAIKLEMETKANALVESILKPTHIKPPPKDAKFNYIVDIFTKWHGGNFYFCSKYAVPGPNAISPFFEDKFARLEYVGNGCFNLSYMRHTGQWWELHTGLSVDQCLAAIKDDPLLQP